MAVLFQESIQGPRLLHHKALPSSESSLCPLDWGKLIITMSTIFLVKRKREAEGTYSFLTHGPELTHIISLDVSSARTLSYGSPSCKEGAKKYRPSP